MLSIRRGFFSSAFLTGWVVRVRATAVVQLPSRESQPVSYYILLLCRCDLRTRTYVYNTHTQSVSLFFWYRLLEQNEEEVFSSKFRVFIQTINAIVCIFLEMLEYIICSIIAYCFYIVNHYTCWVNIHLWLHDVHFFVFQRIKINSKAFDIWNTKEAFIKFISLKQ